MFAVLILSCAANPDPPFVVSNKVPPAFTVVNKAQPAANPPRCTCKPGGCDCLPDFGGQGRCGCFPQLKGATTAPATRRVVTNLHPAYDLVQEWDGRQWSQTWAPKARAVAAPADCPPGQP